MNELYDLVEMVQIDPPEGIPGTEKYLYYRDKFGHVYSKLKEPNDDLRRKKTLDEARAELREELDAGTVCPCCHRKAKRYRRKFNSAMARALIWMWANYRYDWVNVAQACPRQIRNSAEYSKLALWGLAEAKLTDTGSTSREWRVTQKGADFARDCIPIAHYVYVYNSVVEDDTYDSDRIKIRAALTDHFNYDELMGFTNE